MATLEKIRSKSVFLIVVIGLALLAFIVGDALTNSRNLFGDHTTVAKVGDVKVDFPEYQRRRDELSNRIEEGRRQNPEAYAQYDPQVLPQGALDQLIAEKLVSRAAEKLGIRTSAEQLRFYMLDRPVNPNIGNIIQQMNQAGMQVTTPGQAYEVIFNPKRNGLTQAQVAGLQSAWLALEEETKGMIARGIYQQLLQGAIRPNELDKKALFDDFVTTRAISVAYKPFENLDEKTYPVSDAEIQALYDKEKNRFLLAEPVKSVSFIAVNIMPSANDVATSHKLAARAVKELKDSASTISKDLKKEGVVTRHKEMRASDITNGALKTILASTPRDSVRLLSDDTHGFNIVKVGSRFTAVDSLQVQLVQVAGPVLSKKVLAELNNGLPVDSLISRFPIDSVAAAPAEWVALYDQKGKVDGLNTAQLDSLKAHPGRFTTMMESSEITLLGKITAQSAPVEIYEYDEVGYALKPSRTTVQDELSKLEKFLAANPTAEKFAANAAAAGYSVQDLDLNASTPAVPLLGMQDRFYPESRQVVRWVVIDGKPGNVSRVYESKDTDNPALYAVAVKEAYDEYVPATNKNVKEYLTERIRRDKAGDAMVKMYSSKGKTTQEVAAAMQVEPNEVASFRFSPNGAVPDAIVAGRIMGSKAGTPVIVVKGDNGVYAFQVKNTKKEPFKYDDNQYTQQYLQTLNIAFDEMLKGSKKYVNNAYKFEGGD